MTLGVLLATSATYFAWRRCDSTRAQIDSLRTAAMIGSMYCLAGLCAILFPGATWNDPPAPDGKPQLYLFSGLVVVNWIGYFLGIAGSGESRGKGKRA